MILAYDLPHCNRYTTYDSNLRSTGCNGYSAVDSRLES
jgi:hypothetical protein